jgi:predicted  nucleic acid-binding Zn-ribbon protein
MKFIVFVGLVSAVSAADQRLVANPIRKVVSMLQMMQKKVEAEGVREKELFDKFVCYCNTGGADLTKSIADAEAKSSQSGSDIEAAVGSLTQHEADLKTHHADRSAAEKSMKEATAIREKQAADFATMKSESDTNLAALDKAIAALEKGMAGAFLQTSQAQVLRSLVLQQQSITDFDRQMLMSFLSTEQGATYAPQSGEIVGILKQMRDTMDQDLADATAAEKAGIADFEKLMEANSKVIAASTDAIETKTQRVGELKVEIVQLKDDAADAAEASAEDAKFLANLQKDCKGKDSEWEERSKLRAEELVALADTIKVLNDDDALDLFKKTLPGPGASFVQIEESSQAVRERAAAVIHSMKLSCTQSSCPQIDLISLAIHGKKVSFAKVVAMVDAMVTLLGKEQTEDDHKKEYCAAEFDSLDDSKKALERTVSDLETAIAEVNDGIASLTEEIAALDAGIVALDKSVSDATQTRKEEHNDFNQVVADDTAAKELLKFAINRLNKFYNPKLYTAPAKRELSKEDRIYENLGGDVPQAAAGGIAGTGITAFEQKDAPSPPPETWGAYGKKGQESTGVVQMINLLVSDLDKELTEATTGEKNAQAAYEELMEDSAAKRASDSKLLAEKISSKTDAEARLLADTEEKGTTDKKLMATNKVISSLHGECDWLLQNFDARKAARAGEVDALKGAKAILSGADYSFLQANTVRSFLRKPM